LELGFFFAESSPPCSVRRLIIIIILVTYTVVGLPQKLAVNHISMALHIFSFHSAVLQSEITKPSWQIWVLVLFFIFAIVDNK